MAKIRRIIRKLQQAAPPTFDEQLWPVIVAFLVLAAYLLGLAVALLKFDDPRPLYNATLWVTAIPILAGLGIWALRYVDNRLVRRALLLSVLLSLIINLSILVIMGWLDIFRPHWLDQPQIAAPTEPREVITVPEYQEWQINPQDRPRQDFEKPVETGTPEAHTEQLTRQTTVPEQPTLQVQPEPVAEPVPTVQPRPVARPEVADIAPRANPLQSQLSRQVARAEPRPARPVEAPQVEPQTGREAPAVAAQTADLQRTESRVPVRQQSLEVEAATDRTQPTARVARREPREAPTAESTAVPTMQRQVAQPQALPRAALAAETPASVARQTQPDALRPASTAATRQATTSPTVAKADFEPTPPETATPAAQVAARRQQPAEPAPTMAQTAQPAPQRTRPVAQPATQTLAASPQPSPPASQPARSAVAAASAAVSRQTFQAPATQPTPLPSDVPSASPTAQVARATRPPTTDSPVPTISSVNTPAATPARAARTAAVAASPEPVESPAVAEAARNTSTPTAQPARTALARGVAGVAGIGASPNLDRGLPAPDSPATVASASARRDTSTQRLQPGPAIAPSEPAQISRARAGAAVPGAAMKAQPVEVASVAGSSQPASIEASASAALARAASNASNAPITASKGTTEVDVGPTRIVANSGTGRASGGGQPTLNKESQARSVARSSTGGAAQMSVTSKVVAEAPAAPAGSAGGQPQPLDADPEASSLARTQAGGELPTSGGPAAIDQLGPTSETGSVAAIAAASPGRAAEIDALPAPAEEGGGAAAPARAALSRPLPATTQAAVTGLAGAPESSGQPAAPALAAQGVQVARTAGGTPGATTTQAVGALEGQVTIDAPASGEPGPALGTRRASPSQDEGPLVADIQDAGAPLTRAAQPRLPAGTVAKVDVDVRPSGASAEQPQPDATALAGDSDVGPVARQTPGALPVQVDAPEGAGGIGDEPQTDVGLISRRAMRESQEVTLLQARFVRKELGGPPATNIKAVASTDAFERRMDRKGDPEGGGTGRPSPQTEEAIEMGLVFLSRHQSPDGSWSLNNFAAGRPDYPAESASINSDTAATGLALLAYLGAGYHHQDHKYRDVVRAGVNFLLRQQKPDGDLYLAQDPNSNQSAWLYSQAIAAMALCEAYGMTQDPELREPAQKALDFIVASQHPQRGGWRYLPGQGSDTSVSGWMLTALKSGELANLKVAPEVYANLQRWLDMAQASTSQPHLYRYNPLAPDTTQQRHGRSATPAITAVGLLMRMYLGWKRDDERMVRGADYLLEHPPAIGTSRDPQRDTYYWYYATQVLFHMKGKHWETWNDQLHPLLTDSQLKEGPLAGSWNPSTPVPDRWAPFGGRIYVTTMNLLSLEVFYRHLPLYEESAR